MCSPRPGQSACACHRDSATTPGLARAAPPVPDLTLREVADALLPARWRRAVSEWVEAAGADPGLVEVVVLAVNEAATNAVEHAFRDRTPGEVSLQARLVTDITVAAGGPGLVIEVSDRGRWQPPSREPSSRGRGLAMIRAVADRVDRVLTPAGTTITMTWTRPW